MLVSSTISDMSLPYITRLSQCADFSKTVQPYLPQLSNLPQQIFDNINNLDGLKSVYLSTNPLIIALGFALALAPVVLIVAEVNRNYSQVDRLWSVLPVLYNCHYALWAHLSGLPTLRLDHVMSVSILWGLRLTFNYWRKGGYTIGSEDYRWIVVRKYAGAWGMFVFDILFISTGQSLLLWAITSPSYILLLCSRIEGDKLSTYDNVFPKLMFLFVIIEFFADQQQWNFYNARTKYRDTAKAPKEYKYTAEQLDRGFNTSGIWGWSRHPNFAAEQAVWMCLYQWGSSQSKTFYNWTAIGAIGYLILFQASTWFTEKISSEKYPEYATYQKRVGKFLPHAGTESMDERKAPAEKKAEEKAAESTPITGSEKKGKGKTRKR